MKLTATALGLSLAALASCAGPQKAAPATPAAPAKAATPATPAAPAVAKSPAAPHATGRPELRYYEISAA
jgi:hypothetical protein